MNAKDKPTAVKTSRGAAPRQRRPPKGYDAAHRRFEAEAQEWMLERPGRTAHLPEDLRLIVALGLPCAGCLSVIYRYGTPGHEIVWERVTDGRHWAAGITTTCAAS